MFSAKGPKSGENKNNSSSPQNRPSEQALWKTVGRDSSRYDRMNHASEFLRMLLRSVCCSPSGAEFGLQGRAKNQKTLGYLSISKQDHLVCGIGEVRQGSHGEFQWEHLSETLVRIIRKRSENWSEHKPHPCALCGMYQIVAGDVQYACTHSLPNLLLLSSFGPCYHWIHCMLYLSRLFVILASSSMEGKLHRGNQFWVFWSHLWGLLRCTINCVEGMNVALDIRTVKPEAVHLLSCSQ